MIGNDIVDVAEANRKSRWKRDGFLKKIFTENEQQYILNSNDPSLRVWLLWSMKESAYKAYVREKKRCFRSPLKIKCELFNEALSGRAFIDALSFKTFSKVNKDYISTVALYANEERSYQTVHSEVRFKSKDFATKSFELYSTALNEYSEKTNTPVKDFIIKKDAYGVPNIFEGQNQQSAFLSLSHHGQFGAYAFVISPNVSN